MLLLFVRHNYFWKFLSPSLRSSLPTHCALSVPSAKPDRENGILKNQKCTFEFFSVYKPKETGFFQNHSSTSVQLLVIMATDSR